MPKVLPSVYAFCQAHKAAGGLWDYDRPYKLMELWAWLNELKPKSILELGAGCTTAVFCEYVKQSGAKLTTVDEDAGYADAVSTRLGNRHQIEVRGVAKTDHNACYYIDDLLQSSPFDLAYIDGPAGRLIGTDAVEIAAWLVPEVILFDGRVSTAKYFAEHESANYWIDWGIHKNAQDIVDGKPVDDWYLTPVRYHTVARRKR